ncbi:MAG: hypothetical protein AAB534_00435 [Patescibacteria group bacterium]
MKELLKKKSTVIFCLITAVIIILIANFYNGYFPSSFKKDRTSVLTTISSFMTAQSTYSNKDFSKFRCTTLPCIAPISPSEVFVDGFISYKNENEINFYLGIISNSGLTASTNVTISLVPGGIQMIGTTYRNSRNPWNLPEMIKEFDKIVPLNNKNDSLLTLPKMSVHEAVSLALLLATMDIDETSLGIDTPSGPAALAPICGDTSRRALGSDGPIQGFLFIPWFTSDASESCAIEHDICYSNSKPSDRAACDNAFAECMDKATGLENYFYLKIMMIFINSFGSISQSSYPCQCKWDLSAGEIQVLMATNHSSVKVKGSWCCEGQICLVNQRCQVDFLDDTGWPLMRKDGKCTEATNNTASDS